jgi:hypothetical protein
MKFVRLETASLEVPVSNPKDRQEMPMSTLIASDRWLLETSWDGASIGDIQIYSNSECTHAGDAKVYQDGKNKGQKVPPVWTWWGGVPNGKIKSYRFLNAADVRPSSEDEGLPFSAQRKEEPRQASKAGAPAA